ncbi:hypothetical protein QTO34_014146 [Cnephaeus nilssonii]|uniref:Uncharacterized protein n=1 Tax=Cnephaeus nilssonii TaxID=3371016 RepID=A0AA40HAK8_CNENI|nr:hypothetical protein QTO34_014146 [Eptesicus nilssonii]
MKPDDPPRTLTKEAREHIRYLHEGFPESWEGDVTPWRRDMSPGTRPCREAMSASAHLMSQELVSITQVQVYRDCCRCLKGHEFAVTTHHSGRWDLGGRT